MASKYAVKLVKMDGGERMHLRADTGLEVFEPHAGSRTPGFRPSSASACITNPGQEYFRLQLLSASSPRR